MICEVLLILKLLGNTVPVGHRLLYPTQKLTPDGRQLYIDVIKNFDTEWNLVEVQPRFLLLERR